MYLVAIGWMYVVVMMSVAEALSTQGTVLGAVITFVLYGLLPISIVLYVMGSPMRRRQRLTAEAAAAAAAQAAAASEAVASAAMAPDGSGLPPGAAVPAERKEA